MRPRLKIQSTLKTFQEASDATESERRQNEEIMQL